MQNISCVNFNGGFAEWKIKNLQETAQNDKDVEHGVHPPLFAADAVEHSADGVGDTTGQHPVESGQGERFNGHGQEENDAPAHKNVADHGEYIVLMQIDGGQCYGHGGQDPLECQDAPTQPGVTLSQNGQCDDGVGAGNEEINGTVIHHLHHLFAGAGFHAVVYAGHGVKCDHAHAVDHGADNGVNILV